MTPTSTRHSGSRLAARARRPAALLAAGGLAAALLSAVAAAPAQAQSLPDTPQANDYSFNAADTSFTANPDISVYDNGTLIYGTEP